MRTIISILICILNLTNFNAQDIGFDKHYFLLGSLSDYMGRGKCLSSTDYVDYYYPFENPLRDYNYNLLRYDYPDLLIDSTSNTLRSKSLATNVNSKFKFEFDDGFCSEQIDENEELVNSTFVGKFNMNNNFHNKNQRFSYIAGVFTRFGSVSGETYVINIANSLSTYPVCLKLLRQSGSKVKTKITEGVPYCYTIYFKPTIELREFLNQFEKLRKDLETSYNNRL